MFFFFEAFGKEIKLKLMLASSTFDLHSKTIRLSLINKSESKMKRDTLHQMNYKTAVKPKV